MKKRLVQGLIQGLMIFLILLFGYSCLRAEEWAWEIKTIDSTGTTGLTSTIKVISSSIQYIAYRDSTSAVIKFAKTSDSGNTWTTSSTGIAGTMAHHSMDASDADNVFISYIDDSDGDLKLAKSVNGGISWSSIVIESSADTLSRPTIKAFSSTNIYVAYVNSTSGSVRFSKSTDGGTTWGVSVLVETNAGMVYTGVSIDTLSSSGIGVAYSYTASPGTGQGTIKFANSSNTGVTWPTIVTIGTTNIPPTTGGVSLSVIDSVVNTWAVFYIDYYDTKVSTSPNGSAFLTPVLVNRASSLGERSISSVGYVSEGVTLLFLSYTESGAIKLAKSLDNGVTWETNQFVDSGTFSTSNVGGPSSIGLINDKEVFISYQYGTDSDLKVAKMLHFSLASKAVQQIVGMSISSTPFSFSKLKDASLGDNLKLGIPATPIYTFDVDGNNWDRTKSTSSGSRFFSVKRTDIANESANIAFGFTSRKVSIETSLSNTDEVCIDWIGGEAVCPAADISGDDRVSAGSSIVLDDYHATSISVIAASGTQTVYIRAFK